MSSKQSLHVLAHTLALRSTTPQSATYNHLFPSQVKHLPYSIRPSPTKEGRARRGEGGDAGGS